MKLHDISMEISEDVQVYKNKEEKKAKLIQQYDFENSSVYETQLIMNLHTATHIDAPLHAIENGETTEKYDLNQFFGSCLVLDLMTIDEKITAKDLEKYTIKEDTFIILKTKNSLDEAFNYEFIYLEESGAKFLAEAKVKGVGIDGLGIERNQSGHPTHKALLNNNIPILEGLRLKDIKEGYYEIAAFPIKIKDVEASPVRAVLIER
jgi:arylformamidase